MDWDLECRRELACLSPSCLFADINQFWNPVADVQPWWPLDWFNKAILRGESVLRQGPWCSMHESNGCLLARATCAIAGTPCPDWSSQCAHQGEEGHDLMATMAWVALRHELEEDFFVNENVKQFPPFTILTALTNKYAVQTHVLELPTLGWPQRRVRRITVGFNKKKVIARISWDKFNKDFRRKLEVTWEALTTQENQHEINMELRWARSRPSSLFGKSLDTSLEDDADVRARLAWLKGQSAFTDSMTLWELKNCIKYIDMCQDGDLFDLGQDAHARPFVGQGGILPTIIRNTHMLFSPIKWRWLLPSELLLAQGFAVTGKSKVNNEISCFDRPRTWPRRSREMVHQAGNSMNTHMIGMSILWSIICARRLESGSEQDGPRQQPKSRSLAVAASPPTDCGGDEASTLCSIACGQASSQAKRFRADGAVETDAAATRFFQLAGGRH